MPLKRFALAKTRLREGGTLEVTALARDLATSVIEHSAPHHIIVASESLEISDFARSLGVEVFESRARDLNEAVQRVYEAIGERFEQLIIVHGDLKDPRGLGSFQPDAGVTIVTDHHRSGTNVLALPTRQPFRFSYGIDSRQRHELEARRLGLLCQVIENSPWAFDVDDPSDLIGPT